MRISEAWEHYEKDKKLLKYSPYTLKSYKLQTKLLARHLNDPNLADVTYEQLKDYLYSQEHLKASSLAHRVRFIRSLFRWAVDEGYTRKNVAVRLKEPKEDKRIPKFLNEEDVETIRASCVMPLEYAIVEILYSTGCRIGEIVKLNKSDIDWQNDSVIVDGKGGVEREVYFDTKCKIWLKKYIASRKDNDPALIVTERAPRRMSIAQMRYVLKRVAKRAGINVRVYPHRMRHSFATRLLNNGAPMEAIQKLLGHAKSETTQIYAQLSGQKRKEIYKKFS